MAVRVLREAALENRNLEREVNYLECKTTSCEVNLLLSRRFG